MFPAYLYYPIYCSFILGLVPNNPQAQCRGCLSYTVLAGLTKKKGALSHAGLGHHIWYLNEKTIDIYQKVDLGLTFPAASLSILFICFQDISNPAFSNIIPTSSHHYHRYPVAPYRSSCRYSVNIPRIMHSSYLFYLYLSANIKVLEHRTSRKMY
ncbi:hypothetical protein BO79DRAFT_146977 [Aspergillus costaricaensis CBS 115574]|uniref:Uncharacterized protein n=1 Tax=Aspergillus costaricaensis CBS 115574 TaxID=1448317 RepID=A0ACD1IF89_9EURO|nr:hypothetical protein BO79DRAFT_146977 [Aspergillus costaricaensis CBS 115574]RAK89251.1 hypothetical protein BO79DRAFT_146977 [Aspergillus costaricaensis CBS 115574]